MPWNGTKVTRQQDRRHEQDSGHRFRIEARWTRCDRSIGHVRHGARYCGPKGGEILPQKYHQKHTISAFVIGDPRTLANQPSSVAGAIAAFRRELLADFPDISQHGVDERFTSRIALQTIAGSDLPRLKRRDKGLADRISAVLLLQSYLESVQHRAEQGAAEGAENPIKPIDQP